MVKPEFTKASGTGFNPGIAQNPVPTPTPSSVPDFLGLGTTVAETVNAFNTDAFIEGRIDAVAGTIDEDKVFGRAAYLQGAEFVKFNTDLNTIQSQIQDDINQSVSKNESLEEFKNRVFKRTKPLSEVITSFDNRPEYRDAMLRSLESLVSVSAQKYTTARTENMYRLKDSEDYTNASVILNNIMQGDLTEDDFKSRIALLNESGISRGRKNWGSTVVTDLVLKAMPGINMNSKESQYAISQLDAFFKQQRYAGVIKDEDYTKIQKAISSKVTEGLDVQYSNTITQLENTKTLYDATKSSEYQWSAEQYGSTELLIDSLEDAGLDASKVSTLRTKNLALYAKTSAAFGGGSLITAKPGDLLAAGETQKSQAKAQAQYIARTVPQGDAVSYTQKLIDLGIQTENKITIGDALTVLTQDTLVAREGTSDQQEFNSEEPILMIAKNMHNPVFAQAVKDKFGDAFVRAIDIGVKDENFNLAMFNQKWASLQTASNIPNTTYGLKAIKADEVESGFGWFTNLNDDLADSVAHLVNANRATHAAQFVFEDNVVDVTSEEMPKLLIRRGNLIKLDDAVFYGDKPLQEATGIADNDLNAKALNQYFKDSTAGGVFTTNSIIQYNSASDTFELYSSDDGVLTSTGRRVSGGDFRDYVRAYKRQQDNAMMAEDSARIVETVYSSDDTDTATQVTGRPIEGGVFSLLGNKSKTYTVLGNSLGNDVLVGQAMIDELEKHRAFYGDNVIDSEESDIQKYIISGRKVNSARLENTKNRFQNLTGMPVDRLIDSVFSSLEETVKISSKTNPELSYTQISKEDALELAQATKDVTDVVTPSGIIKAKDWLGLSSFIMGGIATNYDAAIQGYQKPVNAVDREKLFTLIGNTGKTGNSFLLNETLIGLTGKDVSAWLEEYKKYSEVTGSDDTVETLGASVYSYRPGIIRGPFTITRDWVNGPLGVAGLDVAKNLYNNEGFIIRPANTRSKEDQMNPNLTQKLVIGLGTSEDHKLFWSKFKAVQGDPLEVSKLTGMFSSWYFRGMPMKARNLGLDWESLTTNPKYRDLILGWTDYLWHGGNNSELYDRAIGLAKNNKLKDAIALVRSSAPYKQSKEKRRAVLINGLVAASRL